MIRHGIIFAAAYAAIGGAPVAAQGGIGGRWIGGIQVAGTTIPLEVVFTVHGDSVSATVDIQGATGIPLQNVRYDAPAIHFELPAGPGVATFDGQHVGDSASGVFAQAGMTGSFSLARAGMTAEAMDGEDVPYLSEDVTFRNDSITLGGTLTVPEGNGGPFPAVVLVSGSGPQDRDETLFGFKPFRILADHLTRNGIAVLRYDDRGVGMSSGNVLNATSEDFARDALAGVRLLAARAEVDANKVGIIGHSEGGIVAPLAARQSEQVAFLVALAGTTLSGADILVAQGDLIARADGAPDSAIARQTAAQVQMFEAVRTGEGWDEVARTVETQIRSAVEAMPAEQRQSITDPDTYVKTQVAAQMQFLRSPWFAFFLDHDPAQIYADVDVPVLAIYGGKDLQVPAEPNRRALEDAMRGKDLTVRTFPHANHLFQRATTGSPSEYPNLEKQFVEGLLTTISDWILER